MLSSGTLYVLYVTAPYMLCCVVRQVSVQSLVGMAQSLASQAAAQLISLDMPASHVAAVVVTAGRKAAGLHPIWPKSLMVVTGLLNPQASAPAQQLLTELTAPTSSS